MYERQQEYIIEREGECRIHSRILASYPGVRGEGRRKRTPGTHCLRMRSISEESRKIGYFRNPPHNVDANF